MRDIFIVSDTHFNHKNILTFTDSEGKIFRNFDSVEEMNQTMIDNWNRVVTPQDIVYHLGDVYFGDPKEADKILHQLKGSKRLLLGNHDDGKDPILHKYFQKILLWRMFPEFKVLLTHVPVHQSNLKIYVVEEEYAEGDVGKVQKRFKNLHGHIHQNPSPGEDYVNCCVEVQNYTPKPLEELIK